MKLMKAVGITSYSSLVNLLMKGSWPLFIRYSKPACLYQM